jgi:hypothetical protein
MLGDDGPEELFRGVAARWSAGASLLPDRDGHLLVWPGGGALRPLVTSARLTGTVVAASADGRSVAVDGRIAGDEGLWLVDVAEGTARRLRLRSDPPLSAISAATFDAGGRLYAAGPARIVVRRGTALVPLRLPRGAPAPVGPLTWVP